MNALSSMVLLASGSDSCGEELSVWLQTEHVGVSVDVCGFSL